MVDAYNQFLALLMLWGGALLGLAIGAAYFAKAPHEAQLLLRLTSSAFGPSVALLFVSAGLLWPEHYRYNPHGVQAYLWLQLLPLFLLGFTLTKYPGPRRLHWYLVPLGLVAWVWSFLWAYTFVHGK
jgi:hypothetical protein